MLIHAINKYANHSQDIVGMSWPIGSGLRYMIFVTLFCTTNNGLQNLIPLATA